MQLKYKKAKLSSAEALTIESIPYSLMLYIVSECLDDRSSVALSNCSKRFADIVAPLRLYKLARQGDIDTVCNMLTSAKLRHDNLKFFKFLVTTPTPGWWITKSGYQKYLDTLIQLVWRMRDMRMFFRLFNQLKGTQAKNRQSAGLPYFEALIKDQLSNFKGSQSFALMLFLNKMAKYAKFTDADEDNKIWRSKVGYAQLLVWREMPWVLHLMCTEKSGWNRKDFSKHYRRDMQVARSLLAKRTEFGIFGRHWVLFRGAKNQLIQARSFNNIGAPVLRYTISLLSNVKMHNDSDLARSPFVTRKSCMKN